MVKHKPKVVKQAPKWASSPEEFEKLEQSFEKSQKGGKKRVSSIKSTYDGIDFDSQLEVYCYKQLKEFNLSFEYTKTTFTIIDSFKCTGDSFESDKRKGPGLYLKSKSLQSLKYTPDFIVKGKYNAIIETKGRPNDNWPMRLKLFKKYLTDNNMEYDLFIPHNHHQIDEAIKIIKEKMK